MKRIVKPEWLDELPAADPGALGSRRDIFRLNRLMGNVEALRELLRGPAPPQHIVELGAGDGRFMLQMAGHLHAVWPDLRVTLVDCKNVVTSETLNEFAALGWTVEIAEADVFDWLTKTDSIADITVANLFLHQFTDGQLAGLLELASEKTRTFAACEPRRAAMPLALSRMVGFIGCNAVTRHDAPASVRAGFAARELSALWPAKGRQRWRLREQSAGLCAHTFLAEHAMAGRPRFQNAGG